MRSANFVGAVMFWRQLELLAAPDWHTSLHARAVLKEFAQRPYADCDGYAYSPVEAGCFEYCGLEPKGVRPPGACGEDDQQC
jgi:hypothetical protein